MVTEGLEDAKELRENGMVWGEVEPGTLGLQHRNAAGAAPPPALLNAREADWD